MAKLWTFLYVIPKLKIHGQKKTLKKKTLLLVRSFHFSTTILQRISIRKKKKKKKKKKKNTPPKSNNNNARNKVFITLYIHGVFFVSCARACCFPY